MCVCVCVCVYLCVCVCVCACVCVCVCDGGWGGEGRDNVGQWNGLVSLTGNGRGIKMNSVTKQHTCVHARMHAHN